MRIKILILLALMATGIFLIIKGNLSTGNLSSALPVFPSPTPTSIPTPTPVVFDQSSNLKSELEKSTPGDFSADFNNLQKILTQF